MSITLGRTVNYASAVIRQAPLVGIGGQPYEPATSMGDWVRQFILSPPFAWRWNRKNGSFTTVQGTQDYLQTTPNFGWLEKASINDGTNVFELEVQLNVSEESTQNQPTYISPRLDDDTGNVTFRLFPVPDKVYTVNYAFQNAAPSFTSLADTWSPVPDYMYYLIQQGFLAKVYEYWDDVRFFPSLQLFMRQVVSASEGLTESQKNIFLGQFMDTQRQQQAAMGGSQLGRQGRSGA